MVAGKAGEATAVVLPLRQSVFSSFNIPNGAHGGALSTFDTERIIDPKGLVSDQMDHEIPANQPAVDARPTTTDNRAVGFLPFQHVLGIALELLCRSRLLSLLFCRSVYIHKWQAYIALRHDE